VEVVVGDLLAELDAGVVGEAEVNALSRPACRDATADRLMAGERQILRRLRRDLSVPPRSLDAEGDRDRHPR